MEMAQALAGERAAAEQAGGLVVFLGACAVWRLCPLHEPEPFVAVLLTLTALAVVVELALVWARHEAIACADELILAGFFGGARRTRIEQAVSHRLCSIETPRARRRLANALRWRLRLANGMTRPSPGYLRASAFPPLDSAGRRVFLEEQPRLAKVADRIEQSSVDPRALVILWRIVAMPPTARNTIDGAGSEDARAEELRDAVRQACRLTEAQGR